MGYMSDKHIEKMNYENEVIGMLGEFLELIDNSFDQLDINMVSFLEKAFKFSAEAHFNQYRKFSNEHYITHPIEVAKLLIKHADKKILTNDVIEMCIVALLHDTVEDNEDITLITIWDEFSYRIALMVEALTKNESSHFIDQIEDVEDEFPEVVIIKVADRLHNLSDNMENMAFKTKYRYANETAELLQLAKEFADKYIIVGRFWGLIDELREEYQKFMRGWKNV